MKRWFPDPNEFMSNYEEIHAFVIGFCELFCLWTSHKVPDEVMAEVVKDFSYYRMGKFAASMFLLAINLAIIVWLFY